MPPTSAFTSVTFGARVWRREKASSRWVSVAARLTRRCRFSARAAAVWILDGSSKIQKSVSSASQKACLISDNTLAVASVHTLSMPTTVPSSSRCGLNEKLHHVSSG